MFRLVRPATSFTLFRSCHRGCVRSLPSPHLQFTLRWANLKRPAVSLVSQIPPTASPAHRHSPHAWQTSNRADSQIATLFVPGSETYWARFVRFQPSFYVPANTKARLVLTLCNPPAQHLSVSRHQKQATHPLSSNSVSEIFFRIGPDADAKRLCLINEPVFVRFNNQLKSIRIPSLMIDVAAQEISLDWRQLCTAFMYDEFKCRSEANSLGSWSFTLRRNNP